MMSSLALRFAPRFGKSTAAAVASSSSQQKFNTYYTYSNQISQPLERKPTYTTAEEAVKCIKSGQFLCATILCELFLRTAVRNGFAAAVAATNIGDVTQSVIFFYENLQTGSKPDRDPTWDDSESALSKCYFCAIAPFPREAPMNFGIAACR